MGKLVKNMSGIKRYKLPLTNQICCGVVMYSIGNIINNIAKLCMVTYSN